MTPETIGKPCSSLDIIPTLSNLLGLEYDSRLLSGRDVFSDADPLVIFLNKSFITGRGRFDATLGKFMAADGSETVDPAYIRDILNEINDKFYYAAKILDKDYYRILNLNDLRNKKTS
jgi:phosphoglycerol transferase MdoB-like AlkP superfamily enzyme